MLHATMSVVTTGLQASQMPTGGAEQPIPTGGAGPMPPKDIDIVVYGVTGFAGHRVAAYLGRHPEKPVWAMAGRDWKKLSELSAGLAQYPAMKSVSNVEKILAPLDSMDALLRMAKRAKVILNFAGPYEMNGGEALIRAAIDGGAHYVDVSGESHWKAQMLGKYDRYAKDRKTAIVQSAGGSTALLPDFLSLVAAKDLEKDGRGPPSRVFVKFLKMNGFPSGASVAATKFAISKYGEIFDPYLLSPETPLKLRVDKKLDGMTNSSYEQDPTLRWYPAGRLDTLVTRRTMHAVYPDIPVAVREAQHMSAEYYLHQFINDTRMQTMPPNPYITPGEGPPEWMQKKGSFAVEGWARRFSDNQYAKVTMEGVGDPVFTATAKLTSELALELARKGPANGPGYTTPALAVDLKSFEDRLKAVDLGQFVTFLHGRCKPKNFDACSRPLLA